MTPPFFIVVSLSRCGSTALHRALNAHSQIQCVFEPDFSTVGWRVDAVETRLQELRASASGIKHVWDPSGFPFVSTHISDAAEMSANRQRVVAMNRRVLTGVPARVVFLRRRNALARALSDAIGQQTDLWGPAHPDGHMPESLNEAQRYREQLSQRQLRPVDIGVIRWYLENAVAMEDELRAAAPAHACTDLVYEDLFGDAVLLEQRLAVYRALLTFLGYSPASDAWDRRIVETVLGPGAKLNDTSTLAQIPNLQEIAGLFPAFFADLVADGAA